MRRVIGMDIHRTFGEVVVWENGLTRHEGRVDMTRTALEGFARQLQPTDEVVIEATGNAMAVSRVLTPFVARVVIANPLQVKAIAHAHVKTDKVDAGTLASLHAAGCLSQIWTPDAGAGGGAGWWRDAIRSSATGCEQRTRCMRSFTRTCSRSARTRTSSTAAVAPGSSSSLCRRTRRGRWNVTSANSTGWAKIWRSWTATSRRTP